MASENTPNACQLHQPLFTVAKQFKSLCLNDQKILFQFVDTFLPPHHGLYFLIREILQNGSKRAAAMIIDDGIGDSQDYSNYPETRQDHIIRSVRDYSSYSGALSETVRQGSPQSYPRRALSTPYSDSATSDSDKDSHLPANAAQKRKKKSPRGRSYASTSHRPQRNIYRLLDSTSANAVEHHYERACQHEQDYLEGCQTRITHQDTPAALRLLFTHKVVGIHCNHIAGHTAYTAAQWQRHVDPRLCQHIHYTISYPPHRDAAEEAAIYPPDNYLITLRLSVDWQPSDTLFTAINYLRQHVENRADRRARFVRHHERKRQQHANLSDDDAQHKTDHHADHDLDESAANTSAKRVGILHLLPVDIRKKNYDLYCVDQLRDVTDYVIAAASTKTIKLIDFALLSARDTWALLNRLMDHALTIYHDENRYPIQDSLTSILLHDTEKPEKLIGVDSARVLTLDRYALLWQNGENAKLGDIITFVQSYCRLMRTILSTCCCYFMNRRAQNTRSFIEKHRCRLPKATQGIYFSLFLRMRAGHELLCLSSITETKAAYLWLRKFDRLRETLWRKRQIPYTGLLRDHLTGLQPRHGDNTVAAPRFADNPIGALSPSTHRKKSAHHSPTYLASDETEADSDDDSDDDGEDY